jgi:hypothetical protein
MFKRVLEKIGEGLFQSPAKPIQVDTGTGLAEGS